jgi:putative membrane protein
VRVAISVLVAVIADAVTVGAHGAEAHRDPRIFSSWDEATLAGLLVAGAMYWIGARRLRARGGTSSVLERVAFGAGWLALVGAVLPWVDAAAIERFSAHMAQHELMMLVGAPLIIAGRPLPTYLWALPDRWRMRVAAPLQRGAASTAVRALTAPVAVWAAHGIVIWLWHVPFLYELAIRDEATHTIQHAMFVGTSVLFWWGLIYGRYGRAGYGAAVFYVFTTAVHTGMLGAVLALAPSPLYDAYVLRAGGDVDFALADQQVAGLVMWIPAGILLTLAGIALFAAWLGESERRRRAISSQHGAVVLKTGIEER